MSLVGSLGNMLGGIAWGGSFFKRKKLDNDGMMPAAKGWGGSVWGGSYFLSVAISQKDIEGAVRIWKSGSETITGGVRVWKTDTKDITGRVRILAPAKITGAVTISDPSYNVVAKPITGVVRITKDGSDEIEGAVRIAKVGEKNIDGGVTILKAEFADIAGCVDILREEEISITGAVRIRLESPEKLPEHWEYDGLAEPLDWEKTGTEPMDWEKYGEPEPAEWEYPLKNVG